MRTSRCGCRRSPSVLQLSLEALRLLQLLSEARIVDREFLRTVLAQCSRAAALRPQSPVQRLGVDDAVAAHGDVHQAERRRSGRHGPCSAVATEQQRLPHQRCTHINQRQRETEKIKDVSARSLCCRAKSVASSLTRPVVLCVAVPATDDGRSAAATVWTCA